MATTPRTAIIPIRPDEPLVTAPFAAWTYEDAAKAVKERLPDGYEERRLYGESEDHWNDGRGWVGPRPHDGAPNQLSATAAIRRQFSPHDAIGEVLSAIEDAFSAEAQIGAVPLEMTGDEPTEEQKRLIAECLGLLTVLWDRVRLHELVKPTIRRASYAERSPMRWWIPPGRALRSTDDEGREIAVLPRAESLEQAAGWLALHAPRPETAAVITDEPTQERAAVYLDTVTEGEKEIRRAQIAFIRADKLVIRSVYENGAREDAEDEFDTPYLPMAEMAADNLLTPAVIATQKQLDYFESVLTRAVETAGFPERYIVNAKPTGIWVRLDVGEIPTGPTQTFNGATYQLKPEPRTLGSSITTELVGIDYDVGEGRRMMATPTVERFEPVDPDFAIKAGQHARAKILQMCRQAHRAGQSAAESSGIAYQQARAAFEKDLLNRKGAAESMLRELLTAGLGLIEALAGQVGYFTQRLRITVEMHVDAGPRSPEERQQDRDDVEAGLLSRETAMSRGGVEDVEAEKDRIRSQPGARLAELLEIAKVFREIAQASSAPAAVRALIAAGVEPEIANALQAADTDGPGAL